MKSVNNTTNLCTWAPSKDWLALRQTHLEMCIQRVLLLLAAASKHCRDSAARRAKWMDCCSGKLNDLKHRHIVLPSWKMLWSWQPCSQLNCGNEKSLLILKNHISQSTADLFGSLFKGICTKVQLQSCEEYIRLRTRRMDAIGVYQSAHYAVLERKVAMHGAACPSHFSHLNV